MGKLLVLKLLLVLKKLLKLVKLLIDPDKLLIMLRRLLNKLLKLLKLKSKKLRIIYQKSKTNLVVLMVPYGGLIGNSTKPRNTNLLLEVELPSKYLFNKPLSARKEI